MKKRLFICFIICFCILIFSVVNISKTVGVIRENITFKESNRNVITIKGQKGDKLKVTYSSSIKDGRLNIAFTDTQGNVIETSETGVSSKKSVILNKDDELLLTVDYDDFIGI